jgi:hypothetical protein
MFDILLMFIYFQPRLVQAVFSGNYEEVESLLTKSSAANVSDGEKRTPLHAAAYRGFAEIAGIDIYDYPKLPQNFCNILSKIFNNISYSFIFCFSDTNNNNKD